MPIKAELNLLHLVLSYPWFDKIASGEKTSEFRECSEYWNKRFEKNHYDLVRFQRGYYKDRPANMLFEVKSINKWHGPNDLDLPVVWEIKLGERIE